MSEELLSEIENLEWRSFPSTLFADAARKAAEWDAEQEGRPTPQTKDEMWSHLATRVVGCEGLVKLGLGHDEWKKRVSKRPKCPICKSECYFSDGVYSCPCDGTGW